MIALPRRPVGLALAAALLLPAADPAGALTLTEIARHQSGLFDKSAAEIVAYDRATRRLYVVNGATPAVDIFTIDGTTADTAALTPAGSLALAADESPTSVAVHGALIATAVHKQTDTGRPGKVVFFDTAGTRLGDIGVGDLPDMVTFSPDGRTVLVANEGEPADKADPEGSVSIIDVSAGAVDRFTVRHAGFSTFDTAGLKAAGVRLFPGKTIAQDAEPEYIAVAPDGGRAYVALQENNALAVVDIAAAAVTAVVPLGAKDHAAPGAGLDSDDKDGRVNIGPRPLAGLYMPDGIAAFAAGGQTYVISANEGDARDEDVRLAKATLDGTAIPAGQAAALGQRLKISAIDGDTDGDGDIDRPHAYGARSISIWDTDGRLVWDSGDAIERATLAALGPDRFNATNDENGSGDDRSDDKGPEPEGVTVGRIDGRVYAFVGLERVGGIIMFDVTDPAAPVLAGYHNDRNFDPALDFKNRADLLAAGHLAPEGLAFIPAADSPFGVPLLAVAYEVSGSVGLYVVGP